MPRELILVTRSASRITGAARIDPGYPKDYTPEQMRTWSDDMDRLNHTSPAELDHLQSLPRDQLSPEQQRMVTVHDKYFTDPSYGIKGSLREDGKIELDGGRHRAGYMLERGVDPVPVWVTAPEQRQLDELRAQCERQRPRVQQPRAEQTRERDPDRTEADRGGDRTRA